MTKNRAAAALGRLGGKARAEILTKEQRSESARRAAQARWARTKKKIDSLTEQTQILERKVKANSEAREAKQTKANPTH